MKTETFLRKLMKSPLLDQIRRDVIHGEYVSLKGRKATLKDRQTVAQGFNVVEMVELILNNLEYQDLRNVYNTCAGFRKVVDGSTTLSTTLFLAPDYACRPHMIPLKCVQVVPPPTSLSARESSHILAFDKKELLRLFEEPRLGLLDRLMIQPASKYMKFSVYISKQLYELGGWRGEMEVKNGNGITFGDVADRLVDLDRIVTSIIGPTWAICACLQRCEWVELSS